MDESIKRGALQKVSWNAIITGFFCSIATQITLGLFGAALGFLGVASRAGWGVIGAIWGVLVPVAAGFVGAYVATRIAVADSMMSAQMHGVLVWCLGLLAGTLFLSLGASVFGRFASAQVGHAAGAGAGSFALAGLSALLSLGGAIWGAAVGRRALGETALFRGERQGASARDLGPPVNPTDVTGIPPRTSDYYPSNPPDERH